MCRIATPPSTERVAPRPSNTSSSSSSKPPATQDSSSRSSSALFHPLSKVISGSSSTNTATSIARSQGNTKAGEGGQDTTQHTVRNKSSMLSFSGFVSTLWGNGHPNPAASVDTPPPHATNIASTAMNATSRSTSTVPKPCSAAVMVETSSIMKDIHTPSPSRHASKPKDENTTAADNEVNTGGKRMDGRNEDIKGWLRQTVEATNAYMNEARNAIEAAKAAMGSPDHKKTKTGTKPSSCTTSTAGSAGIPASDSRSSLATRKDVIGTLLDDEDTQDGDLSIIGYERRQGTQSTLESAILETPTSSPLTQQIHPTSSTSINIESGGIIASNGQPVLIHSPLYSPPLKHISQVEAQITTMEASYFDSPLMKKSTKRVIPAAHDHAVINTGEVQYPPSSPIEIVKAKLDNEAEAETGKKSAEDVLRGTLRHALSESSLRRERDSVTPDTMSRPAVSAAKTGYRPSIATIFGIPMTFGTSTLVSDEEKRDIHAKKAKPSDSNSLKESTTGSLSTNADTASNKPRSSSSAASTSAKDTMSSSSTSNAAAAAAPKLLRKTASKHTLRKAASPMLSNAIVVHRDEEYAEGGASSTPTPTPTNKGKSSIGIVNTDTESTPLRNRPTATSAAVLPRGPTPLKYANANGQSASGGGGGNSVANNGTPRQVAHRNPRDSPVGETRVLKKSPTSPLNVKRYPSGPPLALSTSSSKSAPNGRPNVAKRQQSKGQADDTPIKKVGDSKKATPSIMDDKNDDRGLWSPPRPSSSSARDTIKTPLGATRNTQSSTTSGTPSYASSTAADLASANSVAVDGKAKKIDPKPRLKAKESLERILAYKQMQEEALSNKDKNNEGGEIPPVPALPSYATCAPNKTESKQAQDIPLVQAAMIANNQAIIPEDGGASASRPFTAAVTGKANTLKSKSSFTGTLRGILGSAVSGWTDSLPTASVKSQNPNNMSRTPTSTSSSSSRRVTILPANYRSNTATGIDTANVNNGGGDGGGGSGGSRPGGRNKSIRRAKSMYVSQMEAARIKREEEQYRGGSGWIAMERDHSNSLILPTIIISDYTHD